METLLQDLRYGLRMLVKSPGFTSVAVLTLALGIGANSAIFSIVYNTLFRPLPFPDSNRIVLIWETDPNRRLSSGVASPAEFFDWRDQNHVFAEISAWRTWFYTLKGEGLPEQVWGVRASADFFKLLGVKPFLGRDFLPEEEIPGHEQVVILSYGLWQRRFGGEPGLIGKSMTIDERPYTVVGVLPAGFSLFGTSRQYDIWMPFAFDRAQLNRDDHSLIVFARLKPDITLPQAQAEMETILQRLQKDYPASEAGLGIRLERFQEAPVRSVRQGLLLLPAAVGFVLLIACANVANLLLARAATREREIAVRTALGAGRFRILRQLLTESILLALLGGALGLLLAYQGLHFLRAILPPEGGLGELPRVESIQQIDTRVAGFTLVLSCLTGMLFGLAPAFQIAHANLSETLKEGARGTIGVRRGHRLRSSLVVTEVAFSILLLVVAGLLIRSFARIVSQDIGFRPGNVMTMQIWLPESRYADGRPVVNYYEQALERIRALPGVQSAGATNFLPMSGWADYCDLNIQGRPAPPPGREFNSQYLVVDSDYLRTLGIPVERGRGFSRADGPEAPGVALVNETCAGRYWPNEDPVGKQIRVVLPISNTPWRPRPRDSWLTVVGVVKDIRDWTWTDEKNPQIYLPYEQNPSRLMRLVVRTPAEPESITSAIRQALVELDPSQPVTEIRAMNQFLASAVSRRRLSVILLAIFAGFATLLAAVGIYGVMSYAVNQRSHEIGIRMAIGAGPRDVLRLVVGEGMMLVGIGLAMGLGGALIAAYLSRSLLYGVSAFDPVTFAGVALLLAGVALPSCYFPARRATRVEPITALRYE